MRPLKRSASDLGMAVCFLCQESSHGLGLKMKSVSSQLPHSKTLLLSKIENLLGGNFKIFVEKDDVVCECCYKLFSNIDRMETVLKTFLSVKYNLDGEDALGVDTEDNPLELNEINNAEIVYVVNQDGEGYPEGVHGEEVDIETLINFNTINNEHNYQNQSIASDPEEDQDANETSNTVDCSAMDPDSPFNQLPDDVKIPPIDLEEQELANPIVGEGIVRCAMCRRGFNNVQVLRNHLGMHNLETATCRICQKIAPDKFMLKIHIRQVHMKKVDTLVSQSYTKDVALTCMKCDYQTVGVNRLVLHMKTHDKVKSEPVYPRRVRKKEDSETQEVDPISQEEATETATPDTSVAENAEDDSWTNHLDATPKKSATPATSTADDNDEEESPTKVTQPTTPGDIFACRMCGRTFQSQNSLMQHERSHTNSKTVTCRVCEKTFPDKVLYKKHLADDHHGKLAEELSGFRNPEGPGYKCPQCGKNIIRGINFKMHMKIHTDVLSFKCRTCLQVFKDRKDLRQHWEQDHPKLRFNIDSTKRAGGPGHEAVKCPECDATLCNVTSLRNHMTGHNNTPAKCRRCLEVFPDRLFLRQHQRDVHYEMMPIINTPGNGEDKFSCELCGSKFTTRFNLRYHMNGHNDRPVKCSRCNLMLPDRLFLHKHNKEVHIKGLVLKNYAMNNTKPIVFQCNICSKVLSTAQSLALHVERHDPSTGPLECQVCSEPLVDALHRLVHMREQHPGCALPQKKCNICPSAFYSKKSLARHIAAKHGKMTCVYCGMEFTKRFQLTLHERTHILNADEKLQCSQCERTFPNHVTLRRHESRHNLSKTFLCSECGKSFMFIRTLREHMGVHEQKERYTCDRCGRGFVYIATLRMHEKLHDNPYPYPCQEQGCNSRFKTQSQRKMHERTAHSTLRPFACSYCPKTYNMKSTWRHHEMSHTGNFTYNCTLCNYGSPKAAYLATHYRNKHGEFEKADALKKKYEYKVCLPPSELPDYEDRVEDNDELDLDGFLGSI